MTADLPDTTPSPTERTRKSPNRPEPKYAYGDRGFHPGSYPKVGPFEILRQRPLRRGTKEAEEREGRGFYNLAEWPDKRPPPEGWDAFLAGRFGTGTYKILHRNPNDKYNNRSLFYVDKEQVARLDRRGVDTPPEPTDDDEDPRQNPPDSIASFVEQLSQLRQAEQLLRPEPEPVPPPPPPPGFGELIAKALASNPAVMAQLAQAMMPRVNPPPPPPPADPQGAIVARFARDQGLTAEEAIDALTFAAVQKREATERQQSRERDYDRGPSYPPDGTDFPP